MGNVLYIKSVTFRSPGMINTIPFFAVFAGSASQVGEEKKRGRRARLFSKADLKTTKGISYVRRLPVPRT